MSAARGLVVGCGFLGEAVADRLRAEGRAVAAWTGSDDSADRLRAAGKDYPVAVVDVTDPDAVGAAARRLGGCEAILDCVSSGRGGPEQYRRVYLEGARHLLAAFTPPPGGFVFTSSTSVYAQTDGSWVDETSRAEPDRETGRWLRAAEELVRAAGGTVARLSGLYGPGRSVLLRKFLAGEARVEGDGSRWLNQVHRDDAAAALGRLLPPAPGAGSPAPADASPVPAGGEIYNVSDGGPLTQLALYGALAERFGQSLPPAGPVDLDRKRGWTNKRVCNQKLRALGWRPRYATFLEAVPDLLPTGAAGAPPARQLL